MSISVTHILFETPMGYAIFERLQCDEIGQELSQVQAALLDLARVGKMLRLLSFCPFKAVAEALENSVSLIEGALNPTLREFLKVNFPASNRKTTLLGVLDKSLAGSIKSELSIECLCSEHVQELARALRLHAHKLITPLRDGNLERAQLGLGHAMSRSKLRFNINRNDNMIIQAIALLDQLDKDVNNFAMRIREWYSWHFPELAKIVPENTKYAHVVKIIADRSNMCERTALPKITALFDGDENKAADIVAAAKVSMGSDISAVDLMNIELFADRVVGLLATRAQTSTYLTSKMTAVAPNLASLIGDTVAARLISHAGSLTNLAKCPASTVQILGAEKALFRALKTKGKTPKYGLIFHSSFIGKASQKNKGRISRFLANKCSMASRIDSFSDEATSGAYGVALRSQVEERLRYFDCGAVPRRNATVMASVAAKISATSSTSSEKTKPAATPAKSKKQKKTAPAAAAAAAASTKVATKTSAKPAPKAVAAKA